MHCVTISILKSSLDKCGPEDAHDTFYCHLRDQNVILFVCQDDVESNEKFQALQEELIAVKLREAESNLALRELANHVSELDKEWQRQLERTPKDKLSKSQSQALHEELMSSRLKGAESNTTNKQLRLRVMELETSGQITANQVSCVFGELRLLAA